ncbi:MAG TPA: polyprenyl synthetase family protein [Ktedonobacteraceae bacterium]|nr:polyprenyl synthetase family protein [Ktedonobacteraceae bacterium]
MSNNAQPPIHSFAAQQQLLRERLHILLSTLHPALQSDVKRTFAESGKLLSQPSNNAGAAYPTMPAGVWPLLTLSIAQHISPSIDAAFASSVAIATACYVCALDLLDDVEDEDQTPIIQELGAARTLNVSTTLLALAQQALLSLLQQGADQALVLRLLGVMSEATLVATSGQQRDLLAEQRNASDFTREECIEIAAAKAGAIMRLACLLGAICAGASEAECAEFAEMGELLGIAHQLDNDAHDLYYLLESADASPDIPVERNVKTDLARGKKTLPVVLAASMSASLQENREPTDEVKQEYVQALREGIMTTWAICLLYRERANDHARAISLRKPLAPELRLLLGLE